MRQILLTLLAGLFLTSNVHADMKQCQSMIYKDGMLKSYQHAGKTWAANTQQHGTLSSTAGSTIETATASVDPGVTTGRVVSSVQYTSSWGECAGFDMLYVKMIRDEYIEQNIVEIKKQIALGQGHHIASLALASGCKNVNLSHWTHSLRGEMARLYDMQKGADFGQHLDAMIVSDVQLRGQCQI